jgi:nicotinamidase-related amidase
MTQSAASLYNPDIPLTPEDFLRPDRVVLLMWDMQKGLAGKAPNIDSIIPNAQKLIDAADRAAIPVVWSRHVLPPMHLITGPFLLFLMKKQKVSHPGQLQPAMQPGMEETEFVDGLGPKPHHIVIEKSQPSLFIDTSLDLRMKTMRRDTIVIGGVATDIGVELNCRHAATLGYYSVVVEDISGSYRKEAHDRSIEFLRGWTSPIMSTDDICRIWDRQ